MAELATTTTTTATEQNSLQTVMTHPVFHLGGLMVGLAASIALGIWVFMWSQSPDYSVLYKQIGLQDASEIANVLDNAQIKYRLDPDSGAVLVDTSRLNDAKLKVAAANLTPSSGTGFELMEKEQGFGTSALIQSARYHRAQEGELARTITSIASVQHARVHLALPKESAFMRDRRKPTASVMLQLLPGRTLEKQQIAAITNLVAASIPNMETSQVTVVDSKGRLLSAGEDDRELALSASQFDYTRNIEQNFTQRIERILTPIVGADSVRAQVVADIDFTRTEYTKESYNPDLPAVRSEQNFEEQFTGTVNEGAVPGAVTNEPPAEAVAPEQAATQTGVTEAQIIPGKSRKRSTRNFELDKTISHTQGATGKVRRLSIAVVLNHKRVVDNKGKASKAPYTQQEITNLTNLVKEAVGFNALRGDTVNVMNAAFMAPEKIRALPDIPIWKQAWVLPALKQILGGLVVLFMVIKLFKVIQRLAARPLSRPQFNQADEGLEPEGAQRLPKPKVHSYEENLVTAKQLAQAEPKRVAQVVRSWAGKDE